MHNSKLYSILEHFNKYEQNRCRKYIQSPYFNKNETLLLIFEAIIKDINRETKKELSKEIFWKKISNSPYDDVRFRKHLSDLLKLVEGFLAQQTYENNPLHQATYLLEAVGNTKMEKLYNSTMKTARRLSNQQHHRNANYYYHQYEIEKNYYQLTNLDFQRSNRLNVEDIANNLDRFYLAEKLRYFCLMNIQKVFVPEEYKILFQEEIMTHLDKYNYDDIPPIAIYYQILITLTDHENQESYFKLKKLLQDYSLQFPIKEAYHIYSYAMNYCIKRINKGNQKFLEEYFNLYEDLLRKNIIIIDNQISPFDFKNIIVAALRLGKYEWTEKFITDYQGNLSEEFRENAVTYNLAQLYFYKKEYGKVIEQLRNVEYEDITYNLNSKSMLIATYYETDEIEPLHSLLESFRTYLNRHKDIPVQRKTNYKNLIKFTKKLTKIMPGDHKAISRLREEINSTKGIVSISWLKEKIAELE